MYMSFFFLINMAYNKYIVYYLRFAFRLLWHLEVYVLCILVCERGGGTSWPDSVVLFVCLFFNLEGWSSKITLGHIKIFGNILNWILTEWTELLDLKVFLTGPNLQTYRLLVSKDLISCTFGCAAWNWYTLNRLDVMMCILGFVYLYLSITLGGGRAAFSLGNNHNKILLRFGLSRFSCARVNVLDSTESFYRNRQETA